MRTPWTSAVPIVAVFAWASCALAVAHARADESAARELLRMKELIQTGDIWIVPEETQLRRRMESLPGARREYFAARRSMRQLRETLTALRSQSQQTRAAIDQGERQRLRNGLGALAVQTIEKRLEQLRRQASEQAGKLERLDAADETSELAKAALRLHKARLELMNQLLWCRRLHAAIGTRYEALRNDPQVMQAIDRLGGEARLGPIEPLDIVGRRLARFEEEVLTGAVPLIQRGTQYSFAARLGDVAATFSYSGPDGESVVTPSLLKSAGIGVPDGAEQVTVHIDERRIPAQRITLDSVRVGTHELRDVPALAVGPEGEDLGARLGGSAFEHYRVELDGPGLLLRLSTRLAP
ncbi:MAG: aspartyl protease family protein [Pirellulales bacterium]